MDLMKKLWSTLVLAVFNGIRQFETVEDLKKALVTVWGDIREEDVHDRIYFIPRQVITLYIVLDNSSSNRACLHVSLDLI